MYTEHHMQHKPSLQTLITYDMKLVQVYNNVTCKFKKGQDNMHLPLIKEAI
jgi:hypothetical protein